MRERPSKGVEGRPRGLVGDVHRLTVHGSAAMNELREFLSQMRGKKPQEIIGVIAQSGLFSGTIWACVIVSLILGIGTAVPYAWNKLMPSPSEAREPSAARAPAPAAASAAAPVANPAASTGPAQPAAEKPATLDPDVARRLGVDEVKQGTPNSNPFENNLDDLLDGPKKK